MKVEKILYQKIFPTGMMYLNHKIGVEIQVEEKDDWEECFQLAKRMVEQWNLESNPSYATAMEYMKPSEGAGEYSWDGKTGTITPDTPKESPIESHIKTINECKTLNNLKIFEKLVHNTNDENLTHAYMKRHEELYKQK